jgi:type I restriction enzyme S subunit
MVLPFRVDQKPGSRPVPPDLDGAIVSSHYFLFEIDEAQLDRQFLDFFIRTHDFRGQVEAQGSTNYAAIRPAHVLGYQMPLPPLPGQRRIVARIEELAGKIAGVKQLREEAARESAALERSVTDAVFQELAAKYRTIPLARAAVSITDGAHLTPGFEHSGIKFIFVGNVSSGWLHFAGCKYVTRDYYARLSAVRQPRRDDILYTAVGATLGVPAIVDVDDPFCFQRHVAIIRPDSVRFSSLYLWHMLRSETLFQEAWSKTTGSAQPTVPLNAIRRFPIPDAPLDEQLRRVRHLDLAQSGISRLSAGQESQNAELAALLPSILDKVFRGEL